MENLNSLWNSQYYLVNAGELTEQSNARNDRFPIISKGIFLIVGHVKHGKVVVVGSNGMI